MNTKKKASVLSALALGLIALWTIKVSAQDNIAQPAEVSAEASATVAGPAEETVAAQPAELPVMAAVAAVVAEPAEESMIAAAVPEPVEEPAAPEVAAVVEPAVQTAAAAPAGNVPAEVPANAPVMAIDPDQLMFNFQGAPLDSVLDYMSRAAGFIIIKNVDVSGRVDVVSHQPLNRDEAVRLLNMVLIDKGYAAVRDDRILKIVSRDDARAYPLPVYASRTAAEIPANDEMVTQIIQLRSADAQEMINSVRDLLPSYATISANPSSNSIVLTDTQTDIRRITQIIESLDQTISAISTVRVFTLRYADAVEVAEVVAATFPASPTGNSRNNRGGRGGGREEMIRMAMGGGGEGGDSAALQAASRITATPYESTNSVVVVAPEDLMGQIDALIANLDHSTDIQTIVRIFFLSNCDAESTADYITNMFNETGTTRTLGGNRGGRGGRGGFTPGMGATADLSQARLAEMTVKAQADTRTNSVTVSAVPEVMDQIEQVVAQLDTNTAGTQIVQTFRLNHADPEELTTILNDVLSGGTGSGRGTTARGNTNTRGTTGRNTGNTGNTGRNSGNTGRSTGNTGNTGSSFSRR